MSPEPHSAQPAPEPQPPRNPGLPPSYAFRVRRADRDAADRSAG